MPNITHQVLIAPNAANPDIKKQIVSELTTQKQIAQGATFDLLEVKIDPQRVRYNEIQQILYATEQADFYPTNLKINDTQISFAEFKSTMELNQIILDLTEFTSNEDISPILKDLMKYRSDHVLDFNAIEQKTYDAFDSIIEKIQASQSKDILGNLFQNALNKAISFINEHIAPKINATPLEPIKSEKENLIEKFKSFKEQVQSIKTPITTPDAKNENTVRPT